MFVCVCCVIALLQEYIINVDPVTQLGLNTDSVLSYGIGDVQRTSEADTPELLPCGYLVGDSDTISIRLEGELERETAISLAFPFSFKIIQNTTIS